MKLHSSMVEVPLSVTDGSSIMITPITNHTFSMQNASGNLNINASNSKKGKSPQVVNSINLGRTTKKSEFFVAPHKIHRLTGPTSNKSPIQITKFQKEKENSLFTINKVPTLNSSTPHAIHGKLDMQRRQHSTQPFRKMDMQSRQHPIHQLEKLPGKESNILTVNANGGLLALLQPIHTPSNTVDRYHTIILLPSNYNLSLVFLLLIVCYMMVFLLSNYETTHYLNLHIFLYTLAKIFTT